MGDEVLEINSRVAATLSSAALRDVLAQPSLGLLVRTRPEPEGGALLLGSPPHRADGPAEPGQSPLAFLAGSPGKAATCGAGVPTTGPLSVPRGRGVGEGLAGLLFLGGRFAAHLPAPREGFPAVPVVGRKTSGRGRRSGLWTETGTRNPGVTGGAGL